MEDIYRELILDLYRNPVNFGELDNPTHTVRGYNPSCGDDLLIQVKIRDGVLVATGYTGTGCAMSIAAASIVSEKITGMNLVDIRKLSREDVYQELGLSYDPTRVKCIMLYLSTIHQLIDNYADSY